MVDVDKLIDQCKNGTNPEVIPQANIVKTGRDIRRCLFSNVYVTHGVGVAGASGRTPTRVPELR